MANEIENEIKDLQDILSLNPDLNDRSRSEEWTLSYNRDADMVIMGGAFPEGSYYYPVFDTGALLRIDKDKKVYGFAIESAKHFIKCNPELALPLSLIVYPARTRYVTIPFLKFAYQTKRGLNSVRSITSVSDFIAGKAAFA